MDYYVAIGSIVGIHAMLGLSTPKEWQDWQRADLTRLKKLRPGHTNVVFVDIQRKRPDTAAAGAGQTT